MTHRVDLGGFLVFSGTVVNFSAEARPHSLLLQAPSVRILLRSARVTLRIPQRSLSMNVPSLSALRLQFFPTMRSDRQVVQGLARDSGRSAWFGLVDSSAGVPSSSLPEALALCRRASVLQVSQMFSATSKVCRCHNGLGASRPSQSECLCTATSLNQTDISKETPCSTFISPWQNHSATKFIMLSICGIEGRSMITDRVLLLPRTVLFWSIHSTLFVSPYSIFLRSPCPCSSS